MNEMRKLMESINRVELTENTSQIAADIEGIYEEMDMLIDNLGRLIRQLPSEHMRELGRRAVLSHFQMALNNDHDWMGKNMTTLAEFVEMLNDPGHDQGEDDLEENVDGTDYGFDDPSEFMDYLAAKIEANDNLRVEDRWQSRDGEVMELFNDATSVSGTVVIVDSGDYENDGVQFEMSRDGQPLDDHYFEHYDTSVADQIFDLMNMPMENTIGRRPY